MRTDRKQELRDILRMLALELVEAATGLEIGEYKHAHRCVYLLERLAELDNEGGK